MRYLMMLLAMFAGTVPAIVAGAENAPGVPQLLARAMAFSPEGTVLYVAGDEGRVVEWTMPNLVCRGEVVSVPTRIRGLACGPDLLYVGCGPVVTIVRRGTHERIGSRIVPDEVLGLLLTPAGLLVQTAKRVLLLDSATLAVRGNERDGPEVLQEDAGYGPPFSVYTRLPVGLSRLALDQTGTKAAVAGSRQVYIFPLNADGLGQSLCSPAVTGTANSEMSSLPINRLGPFTEDVASVINSVAWLNSKEVLIGGVFAGEATALAWCPGIETTFRAASGQPMLLMSAGNRMAGGTYQYAGGDGAIFAGVCGDTLVELPRGDITTGAGPVVMTLSPDGTMLAAILQADVLPLRDATIVVWRLGSDQLPTVSDIAGNGALCGAAWSNDGKLLGVANYAGSIDFYRADADSHISSLFVNNSSAGLCWLGGTVVVMNSGMNAYNDAALFFAAPPAAGVADMEYLPAFLTKPMRCVAATRNMGAVVGNREICFVRRENGQLAAREIAVEPADDAEPTVAALSENTILVGYSNGMIRRYAVPADGWSLRTGETAQEPEGPIGAVAASEVARAGSGIAAIQVVANGRIVALARDGMLFQGNADENLARSGQLPAAAGPCIFAAAIAPDGNMAAVTDSGNRVVIVKLGAASAVHRVLPATGGAVSTLAFAPDGASLAIITTGGTVRFEEFRHESNR